MDFSAMVHPETVKTFSKRDKDYLKFVMNAGYLIYKFSITEEKLQNWCILAPDVDASKRVECILGAAYMAELVDKDEVQRALTKVYDEKNIQLAMKGKLIEEFTSEYLLKQMMKSEFFKFQGQQYKITTITFDVQNFLLDDFTTLKDILGSNQGTLVIASRRSLTPRRREIGSGHAFVIAKNSVGEIVIIDGQRGSIFRGLDEVRHYLESEGFTEILLFFKTNTPVASSIEFKLGESIKSAAPSAKWASESRLGSVAKLRSSIEDMDVDEAIDLNKYNELRKKLGLPKASSADVVMLTAPKVSVQKETRKKPKKSLDIKSSKRNLMKRRTGLKTSVITRRRRTIGKDSIKIGLSNGPRRTNLKNQKAVLNTTSNRARTFQRRDSRYEKLNRSRSKK